METRRWWRGAAIASLSLVIATVPHRWGRYQSRGYLDGLEAPRALGEGVGRWIDEGLDEGSFSTGSARFDGEWLFGTHVMAALGFGQLATADPQRADEHVARMDRALAAVRRSELRSFDRAAWGRDAFEALEQTRGHVALLGYYGLALALRRSIGSGPHDGLEEAVVAALRRRFEASETGLVETYPGEIYPIDNTAGIAALALDAQARGLARPPIVSAWLARLPSWRDPSSGLLIQSVAGDGRTPRDAPRASGTALAAYFLSFADRDVSASLYEALVRSCHHTVLGFGAMKEYPADAPWGSHGDIDSGPLVFGYSISATGFSLALARIHGDTQRFEGLYATAHLFGAPQSIGQGTAFATGGPLGDAILFAMLTARGAT